MKLKDTCYLEEKLWQPRQHIKKQKHYFADKGLSIQSYGFSNSHVWMWELDHKEGWVPKIWCFWTLVLKKTLRVPWRLGLQEDQTSQSWRKSILIFIGRTDAEAEAPILWPPNVKSWLIEKYPDARKEQEEEGTTEDEMIGWHRRLDGYEFEQALGDGEMHGSLVCCSQWGRKELDMTEQLNWTAAHLISSKRRIFFLFSFFLSFFLPTIQNNCLMCQAPSKPCLAFDPDQIQWNYQIDSSRMCINLYIETIGLGCKKVSTLVLLLEICLLMLPLKKIQPNSEYLEKWSTQTP